MAGMNDTNLLLDSELNGQLGSLMQNGVSESAARTRRITLHVLIGGMLAVRPGLELALLDRHIESHYSLDSQSLAQDLIEVSFQLLYDSAQMRDGKIRQAVCRSLCLNTVPCLLRKSFLRGGAYGDPVSSLGTSIINTTRSNAERNSLAMNGAAALHPNLDIQQDFLQSCRALGLIAPHDELEVDDSTNQSYGSAVQIVDQKRALTQISDPDHISSFAEELDQAKGTADAIVRGLRVTIEKACQRGDIEHVANICIALLKSSHTLDVVFLHAQAPDIIKPLAGLLDGPNVEGQGDPFSFFEQFSAIFLFIRIIVLRNIFISQELDLQPKSFVGSSVDRGLLPRSLTGLSTDDSEAVGAWIKCLLEGNGIDDEMYTRFTPPQTHRLAATIYQQCFTGYCQGVISWEQTQESINYLLETSLIPALIPILTSFLPNLWRYGSRYDREMKIFIALVLPKSMGPEIAFRHELILELFAPIMMTSIEQLPKELRDANKSNIKRMSALILKLMPERPRSYQDPKRVRERNEGQTKGILGRVADLHKSLTDSISGTPLATPRLPPYDFRDVIAACSKMSSTAILQTLYEAIALQAASTPAMEIAQAIICTSAPQKMLGASMQLRRALANDYQLFFSSKDGTQPAHASRYRPGGKESIARDLHLAIERLFASLDVASPTRDVHTLESGLGLSGLPVNLDLDMPAPTADLTSTTAAQPTMDLDTMDFSTAPMDYEPFIPTSVTEASAGARDADPLARPTMQRAGSMQDSMDMNTVPMDATYDLGELEALGGNGVSFDNSWDDFGSFGDVTAAAAFPDAAGDMDVLGGVGGGASSGGVGDADMLSFFADEQHDQGTGGGSGGAGR